MVQTSLLRRSLRSCSLVRSGLFGPIFGTNQIPLGWGANWCDFGVLRSSRNKVAGLTLAAAIAMPSQRGYPKGEALAGRINLALSFLFEQGTNGCRINTMLELFGRRFVPVPNNSVASEARNGREQHNCLCCVGIRRVWRCTKCRQTHGP